MRKAGWRGLFTRSSGPAPKRYWKTARNSALSPWSAATRPRASPGGRCDWWPKKLLKDDWSRAWAGKPSAFCSSATTSSRGGKKMWCVAELNEDYIAKMEDVLEVYERPYNARE